MREIVKKMDITLCFKDIINLKRKKDIDLNILIKKDSKIVEQLYLGIFHRANEIVMIKIKLNIKRKIILHI